MNINERHINSVINDSIVGFFDTESKKIDTLELFIALQTRLCDQLDGLYFLFVLPSVTISLQILEAKTYINSQKFQSGDACRHSVQSSDAVGQGGTLKNTKTAFPPEFLTD